MKKMSAIVRRTFLLIITFLISTELNAQQHNKATGSHLYDRKKTTQITNGQSFQSSGNYFGDEICNIINGNVKFNFDNSGELSIYPHIGDALWPGINYDSIGVMCSGGFALSGYSNGELWTNAMMNSNRIEDYIPGKVGDNGEGKIYYVTSSDSVFGQRWIDWEEAVNKGANFYDGNDDGVYNPVDLNGNGIWDETEDAPGLIGDFTAWCVYNDGLPADERYFPDVSPQGIEIRQTIWTYLDNPDLKNVFFIKYSIYNTGTVAETFDSVYFSVWDDDDIGEYMDDLLGSSPDFLTGYTYNSGEDDLFGINAPVSMKTYITITKSPVNDLPDIEDLNSSFSNGRITCGIPDYDPPSKEEYRSYLLGLRAYGSIIDPCNWVFGEVFEEDCSQIDPHWVYSGNPIDSVGWINTCPSDQHSFLNIGPFSINSGESVDITVAYHFSRGETSLESVALGLEKAQFLRENSDNFDKMGEFKGNKPSEFLLYQNYPNPFNSKTTIRYSVPSVIASERSEHGNLSQGQQISSPTSSVSNDVVNVTIKVYDILGREVATLIDKKQIPDKY
jgi:hypothetical protein